MARPTDYREEFAKQTAKLCEFGATDIEIADFLEIDVSTFYRWKHSHPEFCEAVRAGKEACDERVERSFYNRCVGYEHEAVKIFMPSGAERPVYAPYREHVPPDPGAALNWLKNRRPDQWRDKREVEVTGTLADRYAAYEASRAADGS